MNKKYAVTIAFAAFALLLFGFSGNLDASQGKKKKSNTQTQSTQSTKKKSNAAKNTQTSSDKSFLKSYASGTKKKPKNSKSKVRASSNKKREQEIITTMGGKTRIDFSDMLIEGQTKKADTVYLFERTESKIDSLVKIRKDFRQEIMESYLE